MGLLRANDDDLELMRSVHLPIGRIVLMSLPPTVARSREPRPAAGTDSPSHFAASADRAHPCVASTDGCLRLVLRLHRTPCDFPGPRIPRVLARARPLTRAQAPRAGLSRVQSGRTAAHGGKAYYRGRDDEDRQVTVSLPPRLSLERSAQQPADGAFTDPHTDINRFFELSPDLMGIANAEGRFVAINPAFQRALGYTLAEFTARPFMDYVHADDAEATQVKFEALRAGHDVIGFENRYRCKDGSYRWLLWSASSMRDELTYAVARDITDRKRMDEDLRTSKEQAEEASRLKWEFLASMSHELRTPMNGVIGMIQLLRDNALTPSQIGYVDAQETSAEALLVVLSNLLHFSKLEAGRLELDRSDFEVRRVVEEACQMRTDTAHAKGLKIGHWVDGAVPHRHR